MHLSVKKAVRSFETSLTLYQWSRRSIPEDLSSVTLMWEHQMSRFEYSTLSLTWSLLTDCAVHLVDFTMYQTKIGVKGREAWLMEELWVNSYPLLAVHLITALFRHNPQLSWRTPRYSHTSSFTQFSGSYNAAYALVCEGCLLNDCCSSQKVAV